MVLRECELHFHVEKFGTGHDSTGMMITRNSKVNDSRTRSTYIAADNNIALTCIASREEFYKIVKLSFSTPAKKSGFIFHQGGSG